ncbi:hypothetical protein CAUPRSCDRAFT_11616 [Caulochytrium protostelioides]|uniref:Uncharacterized protein n=1 Tax=Caulochytrium protostelioides TaxID=1555241 RepID=A0A4P9WU00_9FUNG|nr:hypothetical protein CAUPRSCDRAFT_11616 [Caulochytrium protostelioides]
MNPRNDWRPFRVVGALASTDNFGWAWLYLAFADDGPQVLGFLEAEFALRSIQCDACAVLELQIGLDVPHVLLPRVGVDQDVVDIWSHGHFSEVSDRVLQPQRPLVVSPSGRIFQTPSAGIDVMYSGRVQPSARQAIDLDGVRPAPWAHWSLRTVPDSYELLATARCGECEDDSCQLTVPRVTQEAPFFRCCGNDSIYVQVERPTVWHGTMGP